MGLIDNERLTRRLNSLEAEDAYQVDEVLKESPYETTQLVSLIGADGIARGPFVRKIIKRASELGFAYGRIFAAQQDGRRFMHIPIIREYGESGDNLVVVMDFVAGETLQDLVRRTGPSAQLAREVFPSLCDAASELHESFDPPIIHRDLTPSNIIISKGGLTVIDFGIAREFRDGARTDTVRFGTRSFAPPEQFGFGQTTVRSDIFALGAVLCFCLTGAVPDTFVADRDLESSAVPVRLREVILRATAIDPANRYDSARVLKAAFLQAVGEDTALAKAQPAVPSSKHDNATDDGRFALAGRAWNIVLAVVLAALLFACVGAFSNPQGSAATYPTWMNALDFLVLMPLFFLSGAWMLVDKRRIKKRFPKLERYTFRHWLFAFAMTSLALFVIVGVCSSFATAGFGS